MKMLDAPKTNLDIEQPQILNQIDQVKESPFVVTDKGVVLPNELKYEIPSYFIENEQAIIPNSTSYGIKVNGKFVEKLRIDAGTLKGMKGSNTSHYHLNGKSTHYAPGTKKNPGFNIK